MEFGVFVQRVEIHDDSLVIRPMGNTIGLRPPLIITAAEIDELPGRFARTLRQAGDRLGPNIAAPPVAAPDPATEECSACADETGPVPPPATAATAAGSTNFPRPTIAPCAGASRRPFRCCRSPSARSVPSSPSSCPSGWH